MVRAPVREVEPTRRRVRDKFASSFEDSEVVVSVQALSPSLTFVAVADAPVSITPETSTIVWGACVGAKGAASSEEVTRALDHPVDARLLLGRFCLARTGGESIRLITTADMTHTLKVAKGQREVVSTSAFLAAVLAGGSPSVARDRIAEFLAFEFVLGDDELIDNVKTVPEASVVDVSADGVEVRSYWPAGARLERTAAPVPEDFWSHLAANSRRVFAMPNTRLGLTGGRDSTLLAAVAHASGSSPRCFTFGFDTYDDVVAAAAVCEAAGWPHVNLWRTSRRHISNRRVSRLTPWTDGVETARNLYAAPWSPSLGETVFVSGHGGGIGRAVYWKDKPERTADIFTLCRTAPREFPDHTQSPMRDRLEAELRACRALTDTNARALDIFYARNRDRKWTARGTRRAEFVGAVLGFGDPGSVGILLNIPESARRDASFFDATLALDPLELRSVALARVPPQRPPTSGGGRGLGRWTQAVGDADARDAVRLAAGSLLRRGVVVDHFGPRWLGTLIRRALRSDVHARRLLWRVIAVNGLETALE